VNHEAASTLVIVAVGKSALSAATAKGAVTLAGSPVATQFLLASAVVKRS